MSDASSFLSGPEPASSAAEIATAARWLEQGRLVAFPTETVYGLGADAANANAVADIYRAKGRPANHPVIVHVARDADLMRWVRTLPAEAEKLIAAFWPGPLTLICPKSSHVPDIVSGGQDSVGIRCPSHPVACWLLSEFRHGQGGLAAPSANRFGQVSPTTAQHVRDEFHLDLAAQDPLIRQVLDGGPSEVGIESTIIDLSRLDSHGPVVLRPGAITEAQLAACLGRPLGQITSQITAQTNAQSSAPSLATSAIPAPRVSGALDSHYAPAIPLLVVSPDQKTAVLQRLLAMHSKIALIDVAAPDADMMAYAAWLPRMQSIATLPADAAGYAARLYAALRNADRCGADHIVLTAPPTTLDWAGVNDRLSRAAFNSLNTLERLIRATFP